MKVTMWIISCQINLVVSFILTWNSFVVRSAFVAIPPAMLLTLNLKRERLLEKLSDALNRAGCSGWVLVLGLLPCRWAEGGRGDGPGGDWAREVWGGRYPFLPGGINHTTCGLPIPMASRTSGKSEVFWGICWMRVKERLLEVITLDIGCGMLDMVIFPR